MGDYEDKIQKCYDELVDIFKTMKYALVGIDGGRRAFNLLLGAILDKYPNEVQIEACKLLITELNMKQD